MNQERPQLNVAVFGDPPQHRFAARRVLLGDESQPGGELSSVLKRMARTTCGHKGGGGHRAHPRDLHPSCGGVMLFGQLFDPLIVVGTPPLHLQQSLPQFSYSLAPQLRQRLRRASARAPLAAAAESPEQ